MTYVSRIVVVRNADGSFNNAAIHESEVMGGKVHDLDPRPIYADDVGLLAPYLGEAGAAAVSALANRDATIVALTAERDAAITTLTAERDAAKARITALESQLAPTPVLLPVGAFISRFTDEEFIAVRALAQTDATAAGFVARTAQPEPINLASPLFQAAMKYLVAKKVIAADRVAALGAAPEAQA